MEFKSKNSTENSETANILLKNETANLARNNYIYLSLLFGILVMAGALGIVFAFPSSRDPNVKDWFYAILVQILIAIGTSIIASIIFYWLYSKSAEDKVLRSISSQVSLDSINYANELFSRKFDNLLPQRVYSETIKPLSEFNNDFDELFNNSNTYFFKGDSASYATYRLTLRCNKGNLLDKQIGILILDPRDDSVLFSRVQTENSKRNCSKEQLLNSAESLREKIYVTLVTLFDISHLARIEVAFYKEYPFFRTEIFDEGMFLTYYISGDTSTSYRYSRKTLTYDAYMLNFNQNFYAREDNIKFKNDTEEDLVAILSSLGCKLPLSVLREKKEKRFSDHKGSI